MFMKRRTDRLPRRKNTAGFTLTELAIVMGIMALLLGAIWLAYNAVYTSNNTRLSVQELQAITHNIRNIYAEQGGVTDTGTITQALDQLKAFPLDMRQDQSTAAGILFNPWNQKSNNGFGNVAIDADDCAGNANTTGTPQPCFGITFFYLPQNACIVLLEQTSEPGQGLQQINVNGQEIANVGGFPVPEDTAVANCNNSDGSNANDIVWIYSVRSNGS
jgi:prepilin-type N-terminal cleavage/methylation domain-containing protein